MGVDSSPAENQMSVGVSELSRKSDDTVDDVACVLAKSDRDVEACRECLDLQFEKEGHNTR